MYKQFEDACNLIINRERERTSIGTLSEKTLHSVLKHTFEPDQRKQEIKIGTFYADIKNDKGIIEIQTRNFNALRKKLDFFLQDYTVTIVYPIACEKWLVWLDPTTGEVTKKRKSPKKGSIYHAFSELYKIKFFLVHPNIRIHIVLLDIIEYRSLDGWSKDKKKGASRYDQLPEKIIDIIELNSIKDYEKFIPHELPMHFTTKDYKKVSGLNLSSSQIAINVLKHIGVIIPVGKQGNTIIYKRATSLVQPLPHISSSIH